MTNVFVLRKTDGEDEDEIRLLIIEGLVFREKRVSGNCGGEMNGGQN